MTPEDRDALSAFVSEVENVARLYAQQLDGLKRLLTEKGLLTADEIDKALKMFQTEAAVKEALDPRFQVFDRLRRWIDDQK